MASNRMLGLGLSVLMISATLTGCLGLAFQREFMESMRDDPVVRLTEETYGFDYTFESNSIESVYHTDNIIIEFDSSVSQLVINFRAQFPYSSLVDEWKFDKGIKNSIRTRNNDVLTRHLSKSVADDIICRWVNGVVMTYGSSNSFCIEFRYICKIPKWSGV